MEKTALVEWARLKTRMESGVSSIVKGQNTDFRAKYNFCSLLNNAVDRELLSILRFKEIKFTAGIHTFTEIVFLRLPATIVLG